VPGEGWPGRFARGCALPQSNPLPVSATVQGGAVIIGATSNRLIPAVKLHFLIPVLATLFAALPAPAQQADARALLDAFADDLTSLTAEFTQVTVDGRDEVVEQSAGRMAFEAPEKIRWDYLEPFPQVLIADGERLWHYDEALEQVTVRPQPAPEDSPMLVLTRPDLLETFYRVLPSDQANVLRFEPLSDEAGIDMARLTFVDGVPYALDLFDPFGQSTRLTLDNIERNPAIPAGEFVFDVPDGVDVLEGL